MSLALMIMSRVVGQIKKSTRKYHSSPYLNFSNIATGNQNSNIRVTVALSGGVDSAVSAYLLQKQGFLVNGIYMKNWSEQDEGYCSGVDDLEDVDKICHHLHIPYRVVEFQKEYWNGVFQPFIKSYDEGLTPNPDILCNREVKFKALTDYIFGRHSSPDYLATGHYAQLQVIKESDPRRVKLMQAVDSNKDQTYFLVQVPQASFHRIMFPIGHLTKPQVREIAIQAGLPNANRKESMGLCFIGKRKIPDFLAQYSSSPSAQPGNVVCIETGKVIGQHKGSIFYTVGQSAAVSGAASKLFVVDKNVDDNIVYVCPDTDHPSLFRDDLICSEMNWIFEEPQQLIYEGSFKCHTRFRHRQELQPCTLTPVGTHSYHVQFETPMRGIANGQYVAFYKEGECLGGAKITRLGMNYYDRKLKIHNIKRAPNPNQSNETLSPML